jgi:hypothetical protein
MIMFLKLYHFPDIKKEIISNYGDFFCSFFGISKFHASVIKHDLL